MAKRVDIIYFDAASGHRSAAIAVQKAVLRGNPDWSVRILNLVELLQPCRWARTIANVNIEFFNFLLRREVPFPFSLQAKLTVGYYRHLGKLIARSLRSGEWASHPPDAVISVTPFVSAVIFSAARSANPGVHCVTIPVDFAEATPGFWFAPEIDQYYLLATETLRNQARIAGIPSHFQYSLSGMIIDPDFYLPPPQDPQNELRRLGLDPSLPTGLIHFGGQGSVLVHRVAREIKFSGIEANLICLCGRDQRVFQAVQSLHSPHPILPLMFTAEPPHHYLHLADFVIGKPGAMTLTEALITRTPSIFLPSKILRYIQIENEEWTLRAGVGLRAPSVSDIPNAIRTILKDNQICQRIEAARHDGIFSAASLIRQIIDGLPIPATPSQFAT